MHSIGIVSYKKGGKVQINQGLYHLHSHFQNKWFWKNAIRTRKKNSLFSSEKNCSVKLNEDLNNLRKEKSFVRASMKCASLECKQISFVGKKKGKFLSEKKSYEIEACSFGHSFILYEKKVDHNSVLLSPVLFFVLFFVLSFSVNTSHN